MLLDLPASKIVYVQKIEEFVDERQKAWCIHCSRSLADLKTNEDHVPSKTLLIKPRPHHLPVVRICRECNTNFSLDEQYVVTFLSCVLAGSTNPEKQPNASAARALANSPALRARIERSRTEYLTIGGDTRLVWKPDMERVGRVILKNARGHAYFEYGEPMIDPPAHIWAFPLETMSEAERQNFEGSYGGGSYAAWPEVGSRMMTRLAIGEDMSGLSNGAQKGPPMGAEKGPLFHGLRAARRVALSSRSASPRGEPRSFRLHPEGGLGGG